jgi:hypothetical protein
VTDCDEELNISDKKTKLPMGAKVPGSFMKGMTGIKHGEQPERGQWSSALTKQLHDAELVKGSNLLPVFPVSKGWREKSCISMIC